MKLVIQRVSKAQVRVENNIVGKIGMGLFVLIGVGDGDTNDKADFFADKVSKIRLMSDENDKMNLSASEVGASILVVSQFTLYANTEKGNRPSFIKAADPKVAEKIYSHFVERLRSHGIKVEIGSFGEYMEIDAKLDGPVTITLEK